MTPDAPDRPPATPPPGRLSRAARYVTSPATLLGATGVLSLAAVAAGAAFLLPPTIGAGELPGDEALDTLSTRSIKANRDYTIQDRDATEALRVAATASVRPVYDLDLSAVEAARTRIQLAFGAMRTRLAESQAARKSRARKDPDPEELALAAAPHYGEFIKLLQRYVDAPLFSDLARAGFSEDIERAAALLAAGLLSEEIVERHELLLAERERGITIRSVGGAPKPERDVRDVERITDLAAIQGDLARLAAGGPVAADSTSGLGRIAPGLAPELSPAIRRLAALLASRVVQSNLAYDREETDRRQYAAAHGVKPVVLQYARGEKIIGDGEKIEKRHLLVFRFLREQARALDTFQLRVGAAVFTIVLVVAVFRLARRTVRRFRPGKRDLVFLSAVLLGNLALLRLGLALAERLRDRAPILTNEVAALLLPLATGTMLVRMLRSGESSVVYALVFTPLSALLLGASTPATIGLVASIVAADRLGRRAGRLSLPIAATFSGIAAALTVGALAAFGGRLFLPETALHAGAAAIGAGLVSSLLAAVIAPLFEMAFGYTSESQLARLATLNHPVLKELIIKAPGTYHHSLLVGALAEAAARKIGAHPLMAKVGGYYHDLGKADAPLMFGENQKAENRLEKLPPGEAAQVLRRHVEAGLERASQARLPRVVHDFIRQHHGTRISTQFFNAALDAATREGLPPPDPADFRYPGPRPRSREAALVMLADAVESASRAMTDATPERLRALVPRVVEPFVLERQLDECDLTLADVSQVIEAMQATLVEVHGMTRVDVLPPRAPDVPALETPENPPNLRILRP